MRFHFAVKKRTIHDGDYNASNFECAMKPMVTVITLGVDDLERAYRFYSNLGFSSEGIVGKEFEYGAVAFFEMRSGLRLAIWPRKSLAHDTGLPEGGRNATECLLSHNVASKAEVELVLAEAARAGARIVKEAHETFWGGYAGYFQDPDEHLWEVVWNPKWKVEDELK